MKVWSSLAVSALFAATAFAQTVATVRGVVVDESGGAIAGAVVSWRERVRLLKISKNTQPWCGIRLFDTFK